MVLAVLIWHPERYDGWDRRLTMSDASDPSDEELFAELGLNRKETVPINVTEATFRLLWLVTVYLVMWIPMAIYCGVAIATSPLRRGRAATVNLRWAQRE
jgi:hypothetical protein